MFMLKYVIAWLSHCFLKIVLVVSIKYLDLIGNIGSIAVWYALLNSISKLLFFLK